MVSFPPCQNLGNGKITIFQSRHQPKVDYQRKMLPVTRPPVRTVLRNGYEAIQKKIVTAQRKAPTKMLNVNRKYFSEQPKSEPWWTVSFLSSFNKKRLAFHVDETAWRVIKFELGVCQGHFSFPTFQKQGCPERQKEAEKELKMQLGEIKAGLLPKQFRDTELI